MRCTIETRDFGTMVFTLYPEYAPLTAVSYTHLTLPTKA